MCEENSLTDRNDHSKRGGDLTRRELGVLSAGVGMSLLLPESAHALEVTGADARVETPEGEADCYFVHLTSGSHPGVLLWPDAFGTRPALRAMGKGLAEAGYAVLVVNPYSRSGAGQLISAEQTSVTRRCAIRSCR